MRQLLTTACLIWVCVQPMTAQSTLYHHDFETGKATEHGSLLAGHASLTPGLKGSAVLFDGFTSYFKTDKPDLILSPAFTINAWAVLSAYPWFRSPVFDLRKQEKEGVVFGVDRYGQLVAGLGTPSDWSETTGTQLPLNQWTMLTLTHSPEEGTRLYVNGIQVAENHQTPKIRSTKNLPVFTGRNALLEEWWDFQYVVRDQYAYFDGAMDELTVFDQALTASRIRDLFDQAQPQPEWTTEKRAFPDLTSPNKEFGARYARLSYTPQWDRLWRVGDYPDVVVSFAHHNCHLVFWRGTSMVPCWVTENGIWYTNEWAETWGGDVSSCAEPIMDRQCRHSHVRIIENNPARVVIHWRYALVDADYKFVAIDIDGRGEWCDEYYTIYPDGSGIRKIDLYYSKPLRNHDWEEAIVLLPPGAHPDEVMADPEITLMNMQGEKHDYSWRNELPVEMKEPEKANIHVVNFKSQYKPFYIVDDAPFTSKEGSYDSPFFRSYAAFMASDYRPDSVPSVYGWWNHWPITPLPGDGRWVESNDRASHFNLTTYTQWKDYYMDDRVKSRIMLHGMSNNPGHDLLPLAKSWLTPPPLVLNHKPVHYEPAERAYVIEQTTADYDLLLKASENQPAVYPAFLFTDQILEHPSVYLNDKELEKGQDFEIGVVLDPGQKKTIIWINRQLTAKSVIRIE